MTEFAINIFKVLFWLVVSALLWMIVVKAFLTYSPWPNEKSDDLDMDSRLWAAHISALIVLIGVGIAALITFAESSCG